MNNLSFDVVERIFAFTYDVRTYRSYLRFNKNMSILCKNLKNFCRENDYWKRFLKVLFKPHLHKGSKHVHGNGNLSNSNCVFEIQNLRNGIPDETLLDTHGWIVDFRFHGRCRNLSHYDKLSKIKLDWVSDMFGYARDRYIVREIKRNTITDQRVKNAKGDIKRAQDLIKRAEKVIAKKRRIDLFESLSHTYESQKATKATKKDRHNY